MNRGDQAKVSVLGGGSWGTALAKVLADKGDAVSLWCRREEVAAAINRDHVNEHYLPGATLPPELTATSSIEESLAGASMVLFVSPSHGTRAVAQAAKKYLPKDVPVVSATKGIENESLMFVDEILTAELPEAHERLAFLSGPSFAKELAQGLPTGVVIAAKDKAIRENVMRRFHAPHLRTYGSDDVVGVECGGALKNVIAIAAGICDGLGLGHNTRSMLITRGLAEVARLSQARGGQALTLAGLAGMGDLVLTCTGDLSRNRTVGFELGRGRILPDILAGLGHVAEGVKTTKSAYDLSRKLNVHMPITKEIYTILYDHKPVKEALRDLMSSELVAEFH